MGKNEARALHCLITRPKLLLLELMDQALNAIYLYRGVCVFFLVMQFGNQEAILRKQVK